MLNRKYFLSIFVGFIILNALALPVLAVDYIPGVTTGQYVKYGNFEGNGQGFEAFNDYDFLQLEVTSVSGKEVTLLSTGQFKNGTALPGNDATSVWNIETGTQDDTPSTQGPIIAANLNQGDTIPPPDTYSVNQSESQTYLGVSRAVNILNVEIGTPDYNTSSTYVYDKLSGMLLEYSTQTITASQPQPVASSASYSVIETNIFGSTPTPTSTSTNGLTITYIIAVVIVIVIALVVIAALIIKRKSL
jgi:hypothetical protein